MDCNNCIANKNCRRRGGVCQLKGDIMNKVDSDVKNQVRCDMPVGYLADRDKCDQLCGVSANLKRKHCPVHGWMSNKTN